MVGSVSLVMVPLNRELAKSLTRKDSHQSKVLPSQDEKVVAQSVKAATIHSKFVIKPPHPCLSEKRSSQSDNVAVALAHGSILADVTVPIAPDQPITNGSARPFFTTPVATRQPGTASSAHANGILPVATPQHGTNGSAHSAHNARTHAQATSTFTAGLPTFNGGYRPPRDLHWRRYLRRSRQGLVIVWPYLAAMIVGSMITLLGICLTYL